MCKCLFLSPILLSVIFLIGISSNEFIRPNKSQYKIPTLTPTPVNQTKSELLVLDKDVVCHLCPPGGRPVEGSSCNYDMKINVSAGKPEKNLEYEYTVSNGLIVGEGAKVIWDMTGAPLGNYQIRINTKNKLTGEKYTETQKIEVADSNCILDYSCPTLSVDAPLSPTKAGETMIFTANVSGGSQSDVSYSWAISDGEIIEGQGTPSITVATNFKMAGKTVKATVEIGEIIEECINIKSASGLVSRTKRNKK